MIRSNTFLIYFQQKTEKGKQLTNKYHLRIKSVPSPYQVYTKSESLQVCRVCNSDEEK